MHDQLVRWGRAALLVSVVALAGCATTVSLAPLPPEQYVDLGPTSGSSCGVLLLGDYVAAFIPIGLADRVQTAKANAIGKVAGATDLINVTIQERWYYWAIGSSRCVTVSGEAIRS